MFHIETNDGEVLIATRERLAEVEHELVMERLKSAKLTQALMQLHQGEVLTTDESGAVETGESGGGMTSEV